MEAPTEVLTITLSLDGNQWCALVGEDLVVGAAGWGDTPVEAIRDLCFVFEDTPYNLGSITLGM